MAEDDSTDPTEPVSEPTTTGDWPAQAADTVVRVIDQVKSKTTDNVVLLVRAIVYGLVILVLGVAIMAMTTIGLLRIADAYLPIGHGVGSATWAAHGLLGLLLTVLGLGAWLSRTGSMRPLKLAALTDVAILIAIVFYGVIDAVG